MIERLTTELETRAAAILAEIDAMGGVLAALGAGYFHREIAAAAYAYQRAIENGEIDVIGVNRFASGTGERRDEERPRGAGDGAAAEARRGGDGGASDAGARRSAGAGRGNEQPQKAGLAAWRAARDGARVSASLDALARAADARENLIPRMIDAVKAGATLGEISGRLRERFGVYREKAAL